MPGKHQPAELQKSIDESLAALRLDKVHVLYLHWPDLETPLTDVVRGIHNIYTQGKFEKFGVSNFTVAQVTEILAICETKNYIKPTIYQGQYNALARNVETEILPFLRENNISFYAWSPAAGGVFNQTSSRIASTDQIGDLWRSWYGKESIAAAIGKVSEAAANHNITSHAVALNWILNHSALSSKHGDGIIIAARTLEQLKSTLKACDMRPLPEDIVQLMEQVWDEVKHDAPPSNLFAPKDSDTISTYLKK